MIKGFNAAKQEALVFEKGVHELFINVEKSLTATAFMTSSATFLLGVATTGIMGISGYKIIMETLTIGEFLSFTFLLGLMIAPIVQMSNIGSQLTEALAGLDRTKELMNETGEADDPQRNIPLNKIEGAIHFKEVSFAYEDEKDVLHSINFSVKAGETIALVGSSGSGKSTILNLIPRFYDTSSGEIKIDGINIKDLAKKDLRNLIGLVTQDSILFNDTISKNITLSNLNANHNQIKNASKVANANEFINKTIDKFITIFKRNFF